MPEKVVSLLHDLIQVQSTSEHEQEIALFLDKHLTSLGYTVERIPIAEGSSRENVYAYLGSTRKTRACLTSHMDTVPPHIPLRVDGSTIYGRGACDDKGPMAAQICALEELRAEGRVKEGDVALLFVVGEEKGGPGMLAANNHNLSFEGVVFGEPTEGKLVAGHKGHLVFELIGEGKAWYVDRGSSYAFPLRRLTDERWPAIPGIPSMGSMRILRWWRRSMISSTLNFPIRPFSVRRPLTLVSSRVV